MPRVLLYGTASCPFCHSAEHLLERKGVHDVERVRVDLAPERRAEMVRRSGRRTVPQIWINGVHVGGCDDLYALEEAGELDRLLAQPARTGTAQAA